MVGRYSLLFILLTGTHCVTPPEVRMEGIEFETCVGHCIWPANSERITLKGCSQAVQDLKWIAQPWRELKAAFPEVSEWRHVTVWYGPARGCWELSGWPAASAVKSQKPESFSIP